MNLSPRLRCLAEEVPPGARLADVGTDHAYLPVRLLQEGKVSRAIAADIRPGPLERARRTASRYSMEAHISFRLCDGLADIRPDEADTIVIAGMGGETIAGILGAAPWTGAGSHLFLLQPMSSIPDLRIWLQDHHFYIEKEHIIAEGRKYYVIMVVRSGESQTMTAGEYWAGRQWKGMQAPLRESYLNDLKQRAERGLAGLLSSAAPGDAPRRTELEAVVSDLNDMIKEWQAWQP